MPVNPLGCFEYDYDREVYNGDLGVVSRFTVEEGELGVDFDVRDVITALASWMSWCWPMRRDPQEPGL